MWDIAADDAEHPEGKPHDQGAGETDQHPHVGGLQPSWDVRGARRRSTVLVAKGVVIGITHTSQITAGNNPRSTLGTVKILVLGSGGREHAIVRSLLQDPEVDQVHVAPGNVGIGREATVHPVSATDPVAVTELAQELTADLVVIGPEAPLAAGVSDALRTAGFAVFGPSRTAAQLESSKAFAKQVMHDAAVPTGQSRVATIWDEAAAALDEFGAPYVVKDDGLAAGKGVVVTEDRNDALDHARACFEAGSQVVVEEFLDGPEVSVFVIADGTTAVALQPAQDFKRIFDGDTGPNTGGMGAYTPLDWLPDDFTDEVLRTVAQPVLEEMSRRGTPFNGVLYCGLAVTSRGIRVIEFNTRFGDPETQAVLAQLRTPLGQLLHAAALGNTLPTPQFAPGYAVDVVLAAEGYPDTPVKGAVITGIEDAEALENVSVLHAGTAATTSATSTTASELTAAGGRVLAVVGTADTLAAARQRAYAGVNTIGLAGSQWRTDIALKAERGEITLPEADRGDELPGWRHVYSGKVRDIYEPADSEPGESTHLLVVATDRISAYDHVLSPGIPDKGRILTQLSLWWFDQLVADDDHLAHHVVSLEVPEEVSGRAMVVRRLQMFPVECIARGYLTGSGLAEYREHGTVTGIELPEGLTDGSRLDPPIFTPSAKAELGEHDENITFDEMVARVGQLPAEKMRDLTLEIYTTAERTARAAGIILADTKVEFGVDLLTGLITLGDEVLTPDSSRFWDAETYQPGQPQASFDKQFVRDWLTSDASGWDKNSGDTPPELPNEIVAKTRQRYAEAFQRLTGRQF